MTDRPRPPLRLVSSRPLGDPLPADEGDDWALNDEDEALAFPWAPPPVFPSHPEPSSLTELVGLWGALTEEQRQWVLITVRKLAAGEPQDG